MNVPLLISIIERMEEVGRATAKRLHDAIAVLEMELPSTEPPATRHRIGSQDQTDETRSIELPSESVEECGVE